MHVKKQKFKYRVTYEEGKWYIMDGDPDKDKLSMNGTWNLVDDYMELNNNNVLKSGQTSFEVIIQPNTNTVNLI